MEAKPKVPDSQDTPTSALKIPALASELADVTHRAHTHTCTHSYLPALPGLPITQVHRDNRFLPLSQQL